MGCNDVFLTPTRLIMRIPAKKNQHFDYKLFNNISLDS